MFIPLLVMTKGKYILTQNVILKVYQGILSQTQVDNNL